MPSSLERYYQECGRAGRDGLSSTCVCWFSEKDYDRNKKLIGQSSGALPQSFFRQLEDMRSFCMNNIQCRRKGLLEYFGEQFDARGCGQMCDVCVNSFCSQQNKELLNISTQERNQRLLGGHVGGFSIGGAGSTMNGNNISGVASSSSSAASHANNLTDMTDIAKQLLQYVQTIERNSEADLTIAKLRDAAAGVALPKPPSRVRGFPKRGRKKGAWKTNRNANVQEAKREAIMEHRLFGFCKERWGDTTTTKTILEQLIRQMIGLEILAEVVKSNADTAASTKGRGRRRKASSFTWTILTPGPHAQEFLNGRRMTVGMDLSQFAMANPSGSASSSSSTGRRSPREAQTNLGGGAAAGKKNSKSSNLDADVDLDDLFADAYPEDMIDDDFSDDEDDDDDDEYSDEDAHLFGAYLSSNRAGTTTTTTLGGSSGINNTMNLNDAGRSSSSVIAGKQTRNESAVNNVANTSRTSTTGALGTIVRENDQPRSSIFDEVRMLDSAASSSGNVSNHKIKIQDETPTVKNPLLASLAAKRRKIGETATSTGSASYSNANVATLHATRGDAGSSSPDDVSFGSIFSCDQPFSSGRNQSSIPAVPSNSRNDPLPASRASNVAPKKSAEPQISSMDRLRAAMAKTSKWALGKNSGDAGPCSLSAQPKQPAAGMTSTASGVSGPSSWIRDGSSHPTSVPPRSSDNPFQLGATRTTGARGSHGSPSAGASTGAGASNTKNTSGAPAAKASNITSTNFGSLW